MGRAGDQDLERDERGPARRRQADDGRTAGADPRHEGEQGYLNETLAAFVTCSQLMNAAKAPPSARLKPFASSMKSACTHLGNGRPRRRARHRRRSTRSRTRSSGRSRSQTAFGEFQKGSGKLRRRASSCSRSAARTSSAARPRRRARLRLTAMPRLRPRTYACAHAGATRDRGLAAPARPRRQALADRPGGAGAHRDAEDVRPAARGARGRGLPGARRRGEALPLPDRRRRARADGAPDERGPAQLPRAGREGPEDADVPARASRTAASSCSPRPARSGARASGFCGPDALEEELAHLGPEADELDAESLGRILASDSRRLHSLLRDQRADRRASAAPGRTRSSTSAQLSPYALSTQLDDEEIARLADAIRSRARARHRAAPDGRRRTPPTYRVHDRLGEPCWRCGTPLARVDFEEHTIYYCTGLPDRGPRAQGPPPLAPAAMRIEQVTEATPELVATIERLLPQLSEARTPPTLERAAADGRGRDDARSPAATTGRSSARSRSSLPRRVGLEGADRGRDRRRGGPRPGHRRGARRARRSAAPTSSACRTVELTSMPYREAANRLYRRLGFVRKPTNVYVWWTR